jgi:alkylation response protein AidB-like acyl-CoA dehydrogenase
MDFELSDDQSALQDAARDLLEGEVTSERLRAADGFDQKLWRTMVDQGWCGVELAEARGGLGLGMVEAVILLEQVGRHAAPVPFLQSWLALGALHAAERAGTADTGGWVDAIASGESVGCVAWDTSTPVVYAPSADIAVVVRGDEVMTADLKGARPRREPAMDVTRQLGWLDLDSRSPIPIGDGTAATRLLERGAVAHAAELLGAASRVLEMTVDYAKERVQFGRPIGSFQAVKHRCADMLVDVEGMRSAVYWAAWCIGSGHPDAAVAASTAKVWCSDAARRVMASGLQVHGGIGFTWEHDLHLFMKRAQLDQMSFGDAAFHRQRLAGLLRARVEAGESVL